MTYSLTYNQIVRRIRQIAGAHRQVRNFYRGLVTDFLTDETTLYPSVFMQDNGDGSISIGNKATTYPLQLFFLDLVHLSADAKENELDVMSDMMSIAEDFVALMNNPLYTDWRVSLDNNTRFLVEHENDYIAGVLLTVQIRTPFFNDRCQAPQTDMPVPTQEKIYHMEYVATGTEDTELILPDLAGMKLLLVVREGNALHQVSNLPNSTEYTWINNIITLGLSTNAGERFLILYQNY